jgi:hypothetical protein
MNSFLVGTYIQLNFEHFGDSNLLQLFDIALCIDQSNVGSMIKLCIYSVVV